MGIFSTPRVDKFLSSHGFLAGVARMARRNDILFGETATPVGRKHVLAHQLLAFYLAIGASVIISLLYGFPLNIGECAWKSLVFVAPPNLIVISAFRVCPAPVALILTEFFAVLVIIFLIVGIFPLFALLGLRAAFFDGLCLLWALLSPVAHGGSVLGFVVWVLLSPYYLSAGVAHLMRSNGSGSSASNAGSWLRHNVLHIDRGLLYMINEKGNFVK